MNTKAKTTEKNTQVVTTVKTISYEKLMIERDENGRTMAQNMANKMAAFTEMQAAAIIATMAKQKVKSVNRWAVRQSESEELHDAYCLQNECAAIIAWEKCPKGTVVVPCGTENSDRPNLAFVFKKKGGRRVVGFKFKPTYSMYKKLTKIAVFVDGLWQLGIATDDTALAKVFGAGWNARYIKG